MPFRNLTDFARWFLQQPVGSLRPPQVPGSQLVLDGGAAVTGSVLYRDPTYQVELFHVHAGDEQTSIPSHRHPNVDSYERFVSGELAFIINGQVVASTLEPGWDESRAQILLRVRPRDWHGATIGPMGASFLSIQRWVNGVEPSGVAYDWEGPSHVRVA